MTSKHASSEPIHFIVHSNVQEEQITADLRQRHFASFYIGLNLLWNGS